MITISRFPFSFFSRKFLALVAGVILLGLAVWLWTYAHDPDAFPIRRVAVEGHYPHVDQAAIQTIVRPLVEQGLFSTDLSSIRSQIEALPWVQTAIVTRVWPDQLTITLQEKKPMARVANNGLMTSDGDVFYPLKKTLPAGLPLLEGAVSDYHKMAEAYQSFSSILRSLDLHISELRLTSTGLWSMRLSNGTEIMLGSQAPLARLERFKQVYHQIFDHRVASSVDLRYPHGLAVKWEQ